MADLFIDIFKDNDTEESEESEELRELKEPAEISDFAAFGLSPEITRAVAQLGYSEATAIQAQAIPHILAGRDIVGHSRTGSGKTAAFGLPAIDLVDAELSPKITQILVLCPTRELATQSAGELKKFAAHKPGVKIVSLYGGQPIERQIDLLKGGCQIVIGTPGRIMDHMRRKTLRLGSLKTAVLDEADEMLNMGFREDIETILRETPARRQTILFSATMPQAILDITNEYQRNPLLIRAFDSETTHSIEQSSYEVPRGKKTDALCMLLDYYRPEVSIIFCNTKKMVDELSDELVRRGYAAKGLHGDMRQSQRSEVMNGFKEGTFGLLVATDVAARGIDVNNVDIVINYDLPPENAYYIHRIGRTGRAGKKGRSFTLTCGAAQRYRLLEIARFNKCRIEPGALPSAQDIKTGQIDELTEKLRAHIAHAGGEYGEYTDMLREIGGFEQIAGALFDMALRQTYGEKRYDIAPKPASRKGNRKTARTGGFESYDEEDTVVLSVSLGRRDGVTKGTILGFMAGESGLPGRIFGAIHIGETSAAVQVPKKFATRIQKSIAGSQLRGKKVVITAVD